MAAIGGRSNAGGSAPRQRQCLFVAEGGREQWVPASSRKVQRRAGRGWLRWRVRSRTLKLIERNRDELSASWLLDAQRDLHRRHLEQSHAGLYLLNLCHRRWTRLSPLARTRRKTFVLLRNTPPCKRTVSVPSDRSHQNSSTRQTSQLAKLRAFLLDAGEAASGSSSRAFKRARHAEAV